MEKKIKNLENLSSLMEKDGADALRFAAKKFANLSEVMEEAAHEYEEKSPLLNAKLVSLYIANAQIENAYTFMSGKLSRTIGRLEALQSLKEEM